MRILVLHKTVGHFFGGVETHIKAKTPRLADKGYKITILTERSKNSLAKLERHRNIRVVSLPHLRDGPSENVKRAKTGVANRIERRTTLTKALRLASNSSWMLKSGVWLLRYRKGFDIVAVYTYTDTVLLQILNKFVDIPFVAHLEGYDFIEAENAKKVKFVSAISPYIVDKCKNIHGFEPHFITIGVDRDRFQNVNKRRVAQIRKKYCPNGEVLVLNVARLVPAKDITSMVKAAAIVAKKNKTKFIVCGRGQEKRALDKLIARLNLKDQFFILPITGDALREYYHAADIFLHVPKSHNHFGVVYIEAMATGLPIIAANKEATPHTVRDSALLVEPENQTQIARAILKIESDERLQTALSEAGKRRVRDIFKWNKIINKTDVLFKRAAKGNR